MLLCVGDSEEQVLGGEATQLRPEGSGHIERRWWALVPGMAIGHGCPGAVLEEKDIDIDIHLPLYKYTCIYKYTRRSK